MKIEPLILTRVCELRDISTGETFKHLNSNGDQIYMRVYEDVPGYYKSKIHMDVGSECIAYVSLKTGKLYQSPKTRQVQPVKALLQYRPAQEEE